MTVLSTLLVFARFLSRYFTWPAKWDDWACLGALIFAYGFLTTTALVATVGRRVYHLVQYNYSVLEKYLQIALANNVLYNVSISLTKLSILLFYRPIWVVGGLVAGYFVSAMCGLIFASSPVEARWKTQRRKILLSIVFPLDCFVCIASTMRLYFLATMNMDNVSYSLTTPGIWTPMEMDTGIICSCLPMLPGLMQHFCGSDRRSTKWQ
ncbi:hypothetical protein BDV38DRAFT_270291 [Aspergillus pseudotamarii]|uniref:Rhodopsin domain-containing protein n=1 Tax=Aspergillus pseudotamarii TaxID=132259 RepID=A0A5N6SVU0_ASPPS|nr:uncharacterized protein BDV38DRAFT_270291 [Aspergillus pseudotamarii]KAE8138752.1 hypothetical protein BDV38DRAFT_270291 [Aspergillus pseudotamarii]